ncbi:MAG TPA: TlpA disulfide reductase family protein [Pirellulales bacterium]|jgi:thiol-disulfide isomerase/thioredoxin|nr:TlpA disulfide reductase family protein [Pirellulales bacterium]
MSQSASPFTRSKHHNNLFTWVVLAALSLVVLVYILFFRGVPSGPVGKLSPAVGRKLGPFQVEPMLGTTQTVTNADLAGKVVLIDYWGPRCPPCKMELPELVRVAEMFKSRSDFLFLPISCPMSAEADELDSLKADTEMFLSHIRATTPTYQLNAEAIKAMELYNLDEVAVTSLPTTVIIDQHGVIRGKWPGYREGYPRQVADLLAELLGPSK